MTTDRERYLLARCLRLEAEKAELQGWPAEPSLPPTLRRSLYDDVPAIRLPIALILPRRRIKHRATPAEVAQMRALRARGMSPAQIGLSLGFSDSTARHYTRDVLLTREMGTS